MSRTVSTTWTSAGWSERTACCGLLVVHGGEQLVGDDRGPRGLAGLMGQDLPLASPGSGRVVGPLLDAAQVLAGAEMVLRMVARQHHALGRELGPVAPHHLLQERGAGLRLADVHEDPGTRPAVSRGGGRLVGGARGHRYTSTGQGVDG